MFVSYQAHVRLCFASLVSVLILNFFCSECVLFSVEMPGFVSVFRFCPVNKASLLNTPSLHHLAYVIRPNMDAAVKWDLSHDIMPITVLSFDLMDLPQKDWPLCTSPPYDGIEYAPDPMQIVQYYGNLTEAHTVQLGHVYAIPPGGPQLLAMSMFRRPLSATCLLKVGIPSVPRARSTK